MSAGFSSWVLSIIGVVLISVIVEMILPKGSVSKFIKSVLAIFIVFVIVSPIATIKDSNYFDKIFNLNAIEIDVSYVKTINEQKVAEYQKNITTILNESGFLNISVNIDAEIDKEIKINKVYVNICNLVLNSNISHIDKYTKMIAIITSVVDVKKENIVFNE